MDEREVADAIRVYALTAPQSTLAGHDLLVRDQWQGSENLLWRLRSTGNRAIPAVDAAGAAGDVVIKMYMDAGWVRGRREHEAQRVFAPSGLAPQPLWFDRDADQLPRQVIAYTWAEGYAPDLADAHTRAAVAQAVAQLHATDPALLPRVSPNPMGFTAWWANLEASVGAARTWLVGAAPVLAAALDDLHAAAASCTAESAARTQHAPTTPVHGDLDPANILITPAGVCLLDWELSGLGDPALEVARFTQGHLPDDGARIEFLDAYLARCAQPELDTRIALYTRLLPLDWLGVLLSGLRDSAADLEPGERDDLALLLTAVFARAAAALDAAPPPDPAAIARLVQSA